MCVNTFIVSCNTLPMKGAPDYKVTLPVHATTMYVATTNKVLKEQISMVYQEHCLYKNNKKLWI